MREVWWRGAPAEVAQLKDVSEEEFDVLRAENGAVRHQSRLARRVEHVADHVQQTQILLLGVQQLTSYRRSAVDLHLGKLTPHFIHTCRIHFTKNIRNTLKYHQVTAEPPFTVKTIDWMHQTRPRILLSVTHMLYVNQVCHYYYYTHNQLLFHHADRRTRLTVSFLGPPG